MFSSVWESNDSLIETLYRVLWFPTQNLQGEFLHFFLDTPTTDICFAVGSRLSLCGGQKHRCTQEFLYNGAGVGFYYCTYAWLVDSHVVRFAMPVQISLNPETQLSLEL